MNGPPLPAGALGRADLLRALALSHRETLALDAHAHVWFGYVRQEKLPVEPPGLSGTLTASASSIATLSLDGPRLPLRMTHVLAIVERSPLQATLPPDIPPEPDSDAVPQPSAPTRLISARAPALLPEARLMPTLRRLLNGHGMAGLDEDRLIRRLAAAELPNHLPRRRVQRWHPDLIVVLDFRSDLWPYRSDMHWLAERLLSAGGSDISVRLFEGNPSGLWKDWRREQDGPSPAREWRMPPAGTPVLLVGDLGLLRGADAGIARRWRQFVQTLLHAQLRPVALVPLGAKQVDGELAHLLPILRWSPDAPMRPVKGESRGQPQPEGLDELLAMVATLRRVERPLLRALRFLNPIAPLNSGLEGALWCHPDIAPGYCAALRPAAQASHLQRFRQMAPDLQLDAANLRRHYHANVPDGLRCEETLLWGAHATDAACAANAWEMEQAQSFVATLPALLTLASGDGKSADWWQFVQDMVAGADGAMAAKAEILFDLAAQLAKANRLPLAALDWADLNRLNARLDPDWALTAWLVRDPASGYVVLQSQPPNLQQTALGELLSIGRAGVRLVVGGRTRRHLRCEDLPARLLRLDEFAELKLDTGFETITLAPILRPRGIAGWSCGADGIEVRSPKLVSSVVWRQAVLRTERIGNEWQLQVPASGITIPHGRLDFGIDSHGLHASFNIETPHGRATQTLRWIEPGRFLMGAREDEAERRENEVPQHEVTLTQGFWLADTACSQALWQAVMGENPSRFKGDELPVEEVSWDDVQDFLRKLEGLLPGCAASLPTEAQWEYACRAGTQTPFSLGETITPEQVNYDGNYPYAGGAKGEYREKTVPVKHFEPNAWGLYQMHGNVWEWCADGLRDYDGAAQVDPAGPGLEDKETRRAVRGGSWFSSARNARSAFRYASPPGYRYHDLGFRLALRSIERGPGRPGGPEEPARDATASARAERAPRKKKG